ncbi:MAG: carboxylating nicotinate-nucleotide diphosphorylase [Candidatus Omnitrophica bacterium]|nr:carboxylating nicotinate-nucleotide diphosphorylase [Candidatus Omnitrophota bacterium]
MVLDKKRTVKIIKAALKEDVGTGDITTLSTVSTVESIKASIVANEDCILCGIDIAEWVVNVLDCSVRFKPQAKDGQRVYQDKEVAFLEGHARAILSAERTMLNFLCFLSGISTAVNKFVEKTEKYGVKIYDTRKTLPLLRYLEKYAVTVGGGCNHRIGLWDQVLVKENHLRVTDIDTHKNFVHGVRKKVTKNIKIEVEVENLEQLERMLAGSPDIIMLDNMTVDDVKKAVGIRNKLPAGKRPLLEVSGGITLENVEEYAAQGVDRISIGSITDSVVSVDMSLDIVA